MQGEGVTAGVTSLAGLVCDSVSVVVMQPRHLPAFYSVKMCLGRADTGV